MRKEKLKRGAGQAVSRRTEAELEEDVSAADKFGIAVRACVALEELALVQARLNSEAGLGDPGIAASIVAHVDEEHAVRLEMSRRGGARVTMGTGDAELGKLSRVGASSNKNVR